MLLWHGDVCNGLPIKLAYGFAGRGAILKFCGDMQVDISTTYALLSRWRKWRDLRALRAKKPGNLWKMYEIALFSFRSQQNILESHSLTKPWKHKTHLRPGSSSRPLWNAFSCLFWKRVCCTVFIRHVRSRWEKASAWMGSFSPKIFRICGG